MNYYFQDDNFFLNSIIPIFQQQQKQRKYSHHMDADISIGMQFSCFWYPDTQTPLPCIGNIVSPGTDSWAECGVKCEVYSVQCAVLSVKCAVYSVQSIVYIT